MSKIVFMMTGEVRYDSNNELGLRMAAFAVLVYIRNRELSGAHAPGREEILEHLPAAERTIDGALAELKRAGLIVRRTVFITSEAGKAV